MLRKMQLDKMGLLLSNMESSIPLKKKKKGEKGGKEPTGMCPCVCIFIFVLKNVFIHVWVRS